MTEETPARELASPGQMRALHAAARDAGALHADIKVLAFERFFESSLSHLNWRQCRSLIEHYKSASALHSVRPAAPVQSAPAAARTTSRTSLFGGPFAKRPTTTTPAPVQPSPAINAADLPSAEERNRVRVPAMPDYEGVRGAAGARRNVSTSRHYSSERDDVDASDPPVCRPPDAPQPSREQEYADAFADMQQQALFETPAIDPLYEQSLRDTETALIYAKSAEPVDQPPRVAQSWRNSHNNTVPAADDSAESYRLPPPPSAPPVRSPFAPSGPNIPPEKRPPRPTFLDDPVPPTATGRWPSGPREASGVSLPPRAVGGGQTPRRSHLANDRLPGENVCGKLRRTGELSQEEIDEIPW